MLDIAMESGVKKRETRIQYRISPAFWSMTLYSRIRIMVTVAEAIEYVLATVNPFDISEIPLDRALGLTLANDILSPMDSPPFDKSSMDGYAIRAEDITSDSSNLRVIEVITAGQVPTRNIGRGEAAQIMTGAPVPQGADTIVKVEETERSGDFVRILAVPLRPGTNIIRRGNSIRTGACVVRTGAVLNGSRIGALAEVGRAVVPVRRRPRVAVLATGDELVSIEAYPGPGQIRNSNAAMLAAQIEAMGGIPVPLGIARDNRDALRTKVQQGIECDLLVLSGGVSAGTLDLVPDVLAEAGVRQVFHKVEMKPGKPIWFGHWQSVDGINPRRCSVFGLPGNPVGSLVCCEVFVRTAIRRLMGTEPARPQPTLARLEHEFSTRADRPTFHPAKLAATSNGLTVALVDWHGSSDLCGTVAANGMAYLPSEARRYQVGDLLETYAW